jgi:hypothetical protein
LHVETEATEAYIQEALALEQHVSYVRCVLERLIGHHLYAKADKYLFSQ